MRLSYARRQSYPHSKSGKPADTIMVDSCEDQSLTAATRQNVRGCVFY